MINNITNAYKYTFGYDYPKTEETPTFCFNLKGFLSLLADDTREDLDRCLDKHVFRKIANQRQVLEYDFMEKAYFLATLNSENLYLETLEKGTFKEVPFIESFIELMFDCYTYTERCTEMEVVNTVNYEETVALREKLEIYLASLQDFFPADHYYFTPEYLFDRTFHRYKYLWCQSFNQLTWLSIRRLTRVLEMYQPRKPKET